MNRKPTDSPWSLRDLKPEHYLEMGLQKKTVTAIFEVIDSILDLSIPPVRRLNAYTELQEQLYGPDAQYRMPVVYSLAGSAEMQKLATNGCGPAWLGSLPNGPWNECCDQHDLCYNKGGGLLDKLACDLKFYFCLKNAGLDLIAELFGAMVLLFGWPSFDWYGDDDETGTGIPSKPKPCTGTCRGTEYRIGNLRNFQTVGQHVTQVLLNFVPATGKRDLEAEAAALSRTEWSQKCSPGCRCKVTVTSDWTRKVTFITVPGNDPDRPINYFCEATEWRREVSGSCGE